MRSLEVEWWIRLENLDSFEALFFRKTSAWAGDRFADGSKAGSTMTRSTSDSGRQRPVEEEPNMYISKEGSILWRRWENFSKMASRLAKLAVGGKVLDFSRETIKFSSPSSEPRCSDDSPWWHHRNDTPWFSPTPSDSVSIYNNLVRQEPVFDCFQKTSEMFQVFINSSHDGDIYRSSALLGCIMLPKRSKMFITAVVFGVISHFLRQMGDTESILASKL